MTEAVDTKLLEAFLLQGSAPPVVVEMKMVEAVLLASTSCVSNTAILANLAGAEAIDAVVGKVKDVAQAVKDALP